MTTWQMLLDWAFVREAFVAAAAVGLVTALLSVVVVLKRMAFIGQGISHAGFGGYGTALLLGLSPAGTQALTVGFCLVAGLGIGLLVRRRRVEPDTAIGILLVGAMAWGALAQNLRDALRDVEWYVNTFNPQRYAPGWEQMLFGSPLVVGAHGMWAALAMAAIVLIVGALLFKEIVFWAFDEPASRVFGVPSAFIYYLMLLLLAGVVVVGMQLVGFVLISALLILPGATALMLSRRLGVVMVLSVLFGVTGTLGGLIVSIEVGLRSGASMVAVLCALFVLMGVLRPLLPTTAR